MTTTTPRRPLGSEPAPPPKGRTRRKASQPAPLPTSARSTPARSRPPRERSRPRSGKPPPTAPAEPTIDIHPRIHRRRTEVASAERWQRRRRVVALVVAVAATGAAAGSFFSPVLDLDRVEVQGVDGALQAQVREAASVSEGEAMVAIDPAEVRSRVEELAFVAHAQVRLDWPDRLVLTVAAHRPAALLAAGDTEAAHVLTRAADVVSVEDVDSTELRMVRLDRPPSELDGRERLALAVLLTSLGPAGDERLGALDRSADGRYRFEGAGEIEGAEVVVGELDGLAGKAQALEAMLGGTVELDCLQRLDVSVPARVIVARDPACTASAVG